MVSSSEIQLTDEELVQKVIYEDKNWYSKLVKRYEDKLIRYVRHYLNDEDKVIDVVQETFIKSYINLRGFNPQLKFSSWIYRIAHNEAINALKKYHREVTPIDDLIPYLVDHKNDLEVNWHKKEQQKQVHEALQSLPLNYKDVLTLFFLEERSYEEISDILRIPMGTVAIRISRAKAKMKELLSE